MSFSEDRDGVVTVEILTLTARQQAVLQRLAKGHRPPEIARQLGIEPSTVRNHLKAIFRRFHVRSQKELLERMRSSGVL